MMVMQLVYFGLILWFGLYIMNRDARNVRLLLLGSGLVIYSLGVGAALLMPYSYSTRLSSGLIKLEDVSLYLPMVLWMGVVVAYSSEQEGKPNVFMLAWKYALVPLVLASCLWLALVSDPLVYKLSFQVVGCVSLLLFVGLSIRDAISAGTKGLETRSTLLYVPLILFGCTTGLILFVQDGSWKPWLLLGNSAGLLLVAAYVLVTEIKKQGESWLPDFFRSFDYSLFFTVLFSGQVALVIAWSGGIHFTTLLLLLISISISIAFQVFVYPIRALLDHIAFMAFPRLRQERSRLRMVESVQVRIDEAAVTEEMNEEDLYRFTRRALSSFGDLERLASSPLTQLSLINKRLHARGATDEVLERAIELKSVLVESISQLKPRREDEFGTTEEWRFYNALYFPYIIGVKPYSLRYSDEHLDGPAKDALEWFRNHVPERTCYNWQNAAARLVALSLKEKNVSQH